MSEQARIDRLARIKYSMRESYQGLSLWKRLLVVGSIALVLIGVTGSLMAPSKPVKSTSPIQVENQTNLTGEEVIVKVEETGHWFSQKVAPHLWRIGISFLIAFIIGFLFRQFLVGMAFTLGIIFAVLFVVDWLGWIEVVPKIKEGVSDSAGWLEQSAKGFVELIKTRLPSSFATFGGFFIGFMRKRW